MKLTVKAGGIPAGSYIAKLLGVEQKQTAYGDGLLWQFEVVSGPNAGAKVSVMTGLEPTAQNKCGRILSGITGKPLSVGQDIDLATYFGKSYLIVVEKNDKGSRITAVSTAP